MGVLPIYKISRYLEREGPSLCPDRNIKYRGIYLNIYTVSIYSKFTHSLQQYVKKNIWLHKLRIIGWESSISSDNST